MVRYQYQGTPTTPPAPTLTVISGNVTSALSGIKYVWLQYRNRAGYSLTSTRVQATVNAGRGLSITIPEAALPDPSGVCIWEYVLLMSNSTSVDNACVVATVPGYDSDEEGIISPPFTVTLTEDEHFRLSQTVVNEAALPSANRKHGMRRLVDATNEIVEWDAIASEWLPVKPQVFNTHVSSIVGTYGANADISLLDPSVVIYPAYSMAANTASPAIGFWLVNDGSQVIEQGTRIGLTIENGDADVSYTTGITGGVKLVFRGYVNVTTGVLDTIGVDDINPMSDIGVVIPYQGKKTGLTLPKDLPSGFAYWVDIYAELTPALLNNRVTQGSSLKVSVYFYADFAVWSPAGGIFGDCITSDGGKRRILPEPGLTAIADSGSGNITVESGGALAFNNVGRQAVSGFTANQANQNVWIGVDGTCLTAAVQPNGTRKRAVVGTVNGVGFATGFTGEVALNASTQLRVTVNYAATVRGNYPDVIAGTPAAINASFVRIYVRPLGGGDILQFEQPFVAGSSQTFTVGSTTGTNIGTTVPAPSAADFGLFRPGNRTVSTVADSSTFATGTYEVAVAFRYANTVTSISHDVLNGCIFEAGVSLAEALDRTKYYGQPVSDISEVSYADIENWETRYDYTAKARYIFDPTATSGILPFDRDAGEPGRWVSDGGGSGSGGGSVADLTELREIGDSPERIAGATRSVITPGTGRVPASYIAKETNAAELGNIIVRPSDNPENLRWIKEADLVYYASAAPSAAPPFRNIIWIANLTAPERRVVWKSVGTSSVNDWVPFGNEAIIGGNDYPDFTPDFVGQIFVCQFDDPFSSRYFLQAMGTSSFDDWMPLGNTPLVATANTAKPFENFSPNYAGQDWIQYTTTGTPRHIFWRATGTNLFTWLPHGNEPLVQNGVGRPNFTPDFAGQSVLGLGSNPVRSVMWISENFNSINDWRVAHGSVIINTSAPNFTPDFVGQEYFRTLSSPSRTIRYVSVGTTGTADWMPTGGTATGEAAPNFTPDFVGQVYTTIQTSPGRRIIWTAQETASGSDGWVASGGTATGTSAPSFTPDFVGQLYIRNLTSPTRTVVYLATGTSSSADWIPHGNTVISGTSAPSFTPDFVGQLYDNRTSNTLFVAEGTSSSSDWVAR